MAKATILLLNIGSASAFWRLECDGSVGLARMDPLMDFGRAADHVHTIKGGSGTFSSQLFLCRHAGHQASHEILQDILSLSKILSFTDANHYTAFSTTSTSADLLKSKCASCSVGQDKSAYWTPAVYFMGDDGTVEVVPEKPPHKT